MNQPQRDPNVTLDIMHWSPCAVQRFSDQHGIILYCVISVVFHHLTNKSCLQLLVRDPVSVFPIENE